MTDMDCQEFEASIDGYLRSELTEQEVAGFETHSKQCSKCASLFKQHLEISCKEFVDVIADFLEGTLGKEESEVLRRHLEVCPDCEAYLENYRLTVDSLRDPKDFPAPPPDLVRAILSTRPKRD